MAALADSHPANVRRSPGDVQRRSLVLRLLSVLFASLVFSILAEWLGIAFFWPESGAGHSAGMLQREVEYLNQDFRTTVFGNDPAIAITSLAGRAYYYTFQWTRIEDALSWFGNQFGLYSYTLAVGIIAQLFLVRLGILTFSLPVFVLFATVGITSGLAMRDIRRWSGGREFGGVYHSAKRIAPKALVLAWFIYLALPVSLHPNAIILPCAVLFGLNLLIISASYKKYL
tara:strand:- start:98 stop:784 length:687 start_codon:yes stop_codon:yes gene_type:complete